VNFIEKWKFRLFSKKMPGVKFDNRGKTIEFLSGLARLSNTVVETWDNKAYEIQSDPIEIIIDGKKQIGYAVHPKGTTVSIKDNTRIRPVNELGNRKQIRK
jgi:hypothetical protein